MIFFPLKSFYNSGFFPQKVVNKPYYVLKKAHDSSSCDSKLLMASLFCIPNIDLPTSPLVMGFPEVIVFKDHTVYCSGYQ